MILCPHCSQDLVCFCFYCPRCGNSIGEMHLDGALLGLWLLDKNGQPVSKFTTKTVRFRNEYPNLVEIRPARPTTNIEAFVFKFADGVTVHQVLADALAEAHSATQEWLLK